MKLKFLLTTFFLTFLSLESGYKVANAIDEKIAGSIEITLDTNISNESTVSSASESEVNAEIDTLPVRTLAVKPGTYKSFIYNERFSEIAPKKIVEFKLDEEKVVVKEASKNLDKTKKNFNKIKGKNLNPKNILAKGFSIAPRSQDKVVALNKEVEQVKKVKVLEINNDLQKEVKTGLNIERPFKSKKINVAARNVLVTSKSWTSHFKGFDLQEKFQVAEMVSKLAAEKKKELSKLNVKDAEVSKVNSSKSSPVTSQNELTLFEKLAGPIEPKEPTQKEKVQVSGHIDQVARKQSSSLSALVETVKEGKLDNSNQEMVFIDLKAPEGKEDVSSLVVEQKRSESVENIEELAEVSESEAAELLQETSNSTKLSKHVQTVIDSQFGNIVNSGKQVQVAGRGDVKRSNFTKKKEVTSQPDRTTSTPNQADSENDYSPASLTEKEVASSQLYISIWGVGPESIETELSHFDFITSYDSNNILSSDSDHFIKIDQKLSSKESYLSGTILKRSYMNTNIDLSVEQGDLNYKVPLLEKDLIVSLLDKHQINGIGSFVLIDLGEEVKSVSIDKSVERLIYLSGDFKEVSKSKSKYALMLGVEPGNSLLSYLLKNDEKVERLIHTIENEVYFDFGFFKNSENKKYSLFELAPMSKAPKELSIDEKKLNYFNSAYSPTKVGFNEFEFELPVQTIGTRNYIELKHMSDVLFLGANHKSKLYVPNEYFIADVLAAHELPSLENACIVQLNVSKPVSEIIASGSSTNGPMNVDSIFLDSDGMYAHEVSSVSRHVFLSADYQGVMNVKIDYLDNTSDIMQTFCSSGTYLVEQL